MLAGCCGGKVATEDTEEADEVRAFLKSIQAEILVMPGTGASGGVQFGSDSILTLTPQDADAIAEGCPAIQAAAPVVRARLGVSHGDKRWVPLYLHGTTPAWLDVRRRRDLAEGEAFTDGDVQSAARVCVIGQSIKRELFGGLSPIGQEIRMESHAFKVVGVLLGRGANATGLDQDDLVLVPWTAVPKNDPAPMELFPPGLFPLPDPKEGPAARRFPPLDQIIARARSDEEVPAAVRQITELLRERHRIKPGQPDDFSVRDLTELAKAFDDARRGRKR
jgi:hypothetical protein